jgi:hypothetical protein
VPLYLMMISPIAAQQRHDVFRVGALGEAGEAAQVAEQCGDLAAMAFELLLRAGRDDQVGDLRRQEAPQPAHAPDLAHLIGHAHFKLLIELHQLLRLRFDLLGSLAQFIEQPHVLDGDDGLRGEVLDKLNLSLGERTNFLAVDADYTDKRIVL